ncbi:MAG: tetratricopeptide repeat protein [Bacteroidota bacterium]
MNKFFRLAILALILLTAGSCSTKKNTVVTRSYHNLTSHYNVYFNAYDIYLQGIKKIETSFKDDFNAMLPIYTVNTKEGARMVLSDMDKSIKKCSKVIGTHSIRAKPKIKKGNRSDKEKEFYRKNEYVKWVDDAFLLMGKAYFYKHDYYPAIENFEYLLRQFADGDLTDEASLWLARTYLELKKYPEAQQILNRLQGTPEFSNKLCPDLNAVYADWYLRQEDIASAIPLLEKAIADYPSNLQKTRMSYVLAQLYEQNKDSVNASAWFEKVNDMNPGYEMAFNARINWARLYQGGEETSADIRKELMKMLKDAKNIDYLDQIYYALAELDMKDGREEDAVKNYKLSVESNTTNETQKAISFLALAEYYCERNDFIPAGSFYDSCSQSLPETYPGYARLISFGEDVTMLAQNLSIAKREDSLQEIAKMPEEERNKLIDAKIEEAKRIEEEQKAAEEEERLSMQSGRSNEMGAGGSMRNRTTTNVAQTAYSGTDASITGVSSWYFYNTSAASFGTSEFIKKWGRRKLEDNWRRSNKKVITEAGDLSSEGETGEISTPAAGAKKANTFQPTQKEFYLAEIPLNDTLMKESNDRVAQALFNAGKIFKDELKRPNDAIQYFDWLNNRFPQDERLLFSYYNLYKIYEELNVEAEVNRYKELILTKFPDSRSAKIISNPNYFKELEDARTEVMSFYQETYLDYKDHKFATVVDNCTKADTAFALNPIRDKFGLLKIMAYARVNPSDTAGLVKSINDLLFKYPESEVADPAKNLLNYIQKGPSSAIGKTSRKMQIGKVDAGNKDETSVSYSPDDPATHFYVAVVSGNSVDVGKLKFRISNFNVEKFDEEFFEVASTVLDGDVQVITVKNFTNKKSAMAYYWAITADPVVYGDVKEIDFRQFVITKDNYTRFYKNKNVAQYLDFFRQNYLTD